MEVLKHCATVLFLVYIINFLIVLLPDNEKNHISDYLLPKNYPTFPGINPPKCSARKMEQQFQYDNTKQESPGIRITYTNFYSIHFVLDYRGSYLVTLQESSFPNAMDDKRYNSFTMTLRSNRGNFPYGESSRKSPPPSVGCRRVVPYTTGSLGKVRLKFLSYKSCLSYPSCNIAD